MKAIVYHQYGSPDVLRLEEIEKPIPKENEVLVRVVATTVTAGDTRMRSFNVPWSYWLMARIALGWRKPKNAILGMELSGEVEAVGRDVTRFKPGDLVYGSTIEHPTGTYAEYICLPEDGLLAIRPGNLTFEEAATVPVGGRTALYFLRAAKIQPGHKVLIYGASGSVGTFAVQIAKLYGAEVTAVCSGANAALVESLGADKVIDYTREAFTRNGETYDVIFDAVGKTDYAASLRSLKGDGAYLHAVSTPDISLRMAWTRLTSRKTLVGGGPPRAVEDLVHLRELIETGKVRPVIDRRYPLEQAVEAHRYVDKGHKKGNVVITVQNHCE
jgi:NADPH:quinone reductase-like Zn-dependent oxidoreductase